MWLLFYVRARVGALMGQMDMLLPMEPSQAAAWLYRLELAHAIVWATSERQEQHLLVQIARYESGFREDVGRCVVNGAAGDRGPWQVVGRNDDERVLACVDLITSAQLALGRVRESVAACASLPRAERLAVYARGRCESEEGRRLSRQRWAEAPVELQGGSNE